MLLECNGFICSVCLQTRLELYNLEKSSRHKETKPTITKCCLTVCRCTEKNREVGTGENVAGVQWLYL